MVYRLILRIISAVIILLMSILSRYPEYHYGYCLEAGFEGSSYGEVILSGTDANPSTEEMEVIAGSYGTWEFTYIIGSKGFSKGDRLRITFPRYLQHRGWSRPQINNPKADGYLTIRTSNPTALVKVVRPIAAKISPFPRLSLFNEVAFRILPARMWPFTMVQVELKKGNLSSGETITITYGDASRGSPRARAQLFAANKDTLGYKPFEVFRINRLNRKEIFLASFEITVLAGPTESFKVIGDATPSVNKPFKLLVKAEDSFGNLTPAYRAKIRLSPDSQDIHLPQEYTFTKNDGGAHTFRDIVVTEKGCFRIKVSDLNDPTIEGISNPICSHFHPHKCNIYFGDLQVHTGEVSADAYGSMDDCYRYARDVAGLDFVSKTDHDCDIKEKGTKRIWSETKCLCSLYYQPGKFVTILGYEWTKPFSYGHRCVHFPSKEGVVYGHTNSVSDNPTKLWKCLEPWKAIAIPHFPQRRGLGRQHQMDWTYYNPQAQRLVEIYSQWVQYPVPLDHSIRWPRWLKELFRRWITEVEITPNGVQAGLSLGHKFGFIAGSDNHCSQPGATGGLAAVYAPSLSREEIWKGLYHRYTYATTGARILLNFEINGHRMGEEFTAKSAPHLEAKVIGVAPIERLEVVKGWTGARIPLPVVHTEEPLTDVCQLDWKDSSFTKDSFYYIRVTQIDGERAWSSPIWVNLFSEGK